MTDLGQLVFTLALNDEGFQGQLNSATGQVKESGGQMTGSMQSTEEQSGRLGGAFKSMAGQFLIGQAIFTAGYKVLGILNNTVKDGVKNFELWQQTQAQLANSLKTTGDASGQSVKSLNDYADALTKQTGITGNAINSAQLVMLNYKAIGKDIFPEATKQIANFATVLSHGAVPSQDQMTMAAKLLGRALEDPTKGATALTRAGVTLSKQQQDQIKVMAKAGDMAGAQKILLNDLADVIGGKAATASHTLAGEQAKLHAELEKLEIEVGQRLTVVLKALEPILAGLINWFMSLAPTINAVAHIVGDIFRPLISELVKVFRDDLMPILLKHKVLFEDLGKVILIIAGAPIVTLLASLAAVIAIITATIFIFSKLINIIIDVIGWFGHLVGSVNSAMSNFFGSVVNAISGVINWFGALPGRILGAVSGFGSLLFGAGQAIIQGLIHGIENMAGAAGNAISKVADGIKNIAKKVLSIFSPSAVFADIGANVSIGLAQGITKGSAQAVQATQQMTQSVVTAGASPPSSNNFVTNSSNSPSTYNFQPGSVILSTKEAVDEFFNIGNRSTQLELAGGSPLAGTTGV